MDTSTPADVRQTPTTEAVQAFFGQYDYAPDDVLLPYQKRWVEDRSKLKLANKSRRTGLTWAEAADAALTAGASRAAGGSHHFYIGSNKDMAREFIEAVALWCRAFSVVAEAITEELLENQDRDIQVFVVCFASGFKVKALSSRPSNLRGMQGNVTIDEAAFHDQLQELIKAATALTMWGGKVRVISTHNGYDSDYNALLEDALKGRNDYQVHRIDLDDACREGLHQRICQVTGQPWSQANEDTWKAELMRGCATREDALEEYYCVPKQGGGAYLSRALVESRMVEAPVLRFEGSAEFNGWPEHLRRAEINDWCQAHLLPLLEALNPDQHHAFGEDFARSGDLTVIVPIAQDQTLHCAVPFVVELRNVPYKQQEQILFYLVDRLPRLMAGQLDARGNGEYLAEQAAERYGRLCIEEVKQTERWYLENMPRVKAAFEDAEILIPKDADLLDDLRAIQVVRGIPRIPDGNTGTAKSGKRHGDFAVALGLAYAAIKSERGGAIEWTPAPSRLASWEGTDKDDDFSGYRGKGAW